MNLMKGRLEDFNNYTRCIREYFYKDKTEVDKGYLHHKIGSRKCNIINKNFDLIANPDKFFEKYLDK